MPGAPSRSCRTDRSGQVQGLTEDQVASRTDRHGRDEDDVMSYVVRG